MMISKPRTFAHFPKDKPCPVCGTSEDAECILIPIDDTRKDNICEAIPVHLWCSVATQYTRGSMAPGGDGMLYRWAEKEERNG